MSTGALPPLPQGYQLQSGSLPPLPPGYKLQGGPAEKEGFFASVGHAAGIPTSLEELKQFGVKTAINVAAGGLPIADMVTAHTPTEAAKAATGPLPALYEAGKSEVQNISKLKAPTSSQAITSDMGTLTHAAATHAFGPGGGQTVEKAQAGDIRGAVGTGVGTLLPYAVGAAGSALYKPTVPRGTAANPPPPPHEEALTGFLKTTKTDPAITASRALPEARAVAAKEGIDPATFQGRKGGEIVTGKNGIFHKAIQARQAEYASLRQPVEELPLDTTPIAQAYLNKITPELETNAPQIANRLRAEARKFVELDDKGGVTGMKAQPLKQLDDFRVRLNNELDKYEQSPIDKQMRSDIEVKADKAAADAARDLVYKTISAKTGTPEAVIRDSQQRLGALIEARRDLTQAFNDASGAQGTAVASSLRANPPGSGRFVTTAGEKASHLYPSQRGLERSIAREVGPKPLTIFNSRLKLMFDKLEPAQPSALTPPAPPTTVGGSITPEHVARENVFYIQARAELGANASPSAVLQRAQQI